MRMSTSSAAGGPDTSALSDFAGRALILLILGVDCGTCRNIVRILSDLQNQYPDDVACAGVCVHPGCRMKLDDFARNSGVDSHLGYAPLRDLCRALGISASTWLLYPTLIFIDHEQFMRGYVTTGDPFYENTEENLRGAFAQLASERKACVLQESL